MQRYYLRPEQIDLKLMQAKLLGNDAYHIQVVMRMHIGEQIYLSDGVNSYLAEINQIDSEIVTASIIKTLDEQKELPVNVCIAHGLVAREKREDTIQKLTQLGCTTYLPVEMKRSVAKINKEKEDKQTIRLQKIAKEASEQSQRVSALEVKRPVSFKEFLTMAKEYDLKLVASTKEAQESTNFKQLLKQSSWQSVIILVGPEAGISDEELALLSDFTPINLGPRILRTEVAPLYILSAISYEKELGD